MREGKREGRDDQIRNGRMNGRMHLIIVNIVSLSDPSLLRARLDTSLYCIRGIEIFRDKHRMITQNRSFEGLSVLGKPLEMRVKFLKGCPE